MQIDAPASRLLSIHPVMFFLVIVLLLWLGTLVGAWLRNYRERTLAEESSSFKTLEGAVLALLGLLLGFTFSMGVSRYDQRKNLEIAEANDIATEWLRAGALPAPQQEQLKSLLREYVPVRLQFVEAGTSKARIEQSLQSSAMLQAQMTRLVAGYAEEHNDAVTAQLLTSTAELANVTESRTAAFENRIPILAWAMLLFIGFMASILVGVGMSSRAPVVRLILPIVVASALSLTLDLDSPRSGLIRVHQRSLERVQERIERGMMP